MSHRHEKVESTLARAIQQVISQGLHDPRAGGLISVLRVDVSPDMANAMVFVSIYPEAKENLTLHALRHAARHIRHQVGDLVAMRRMPELDFRLDKSLKHQAEVFDALAKARSSTPATPTAVDGTDPPTTDNPEGAQRSGPGNTSASQQMDSPRPGGKCEEPRG